MLLAAGLALVLAQAIEETDRVTLSSGKTLQGRVVYEDADRVVLRLRDRRERSFERGDVRRIDSRLDHLSALLDNAADADLRDADELELLVAQADETGLTGEAQVFRWRLLLVDRNDEAANLGLGHKRRGGGWAIPVGGKAVDWDRRFELARDWGSAWELASVHYRLRSNLPLETSLDVLLDLERLYRAFHELFGIEIGIYDVCQPMTVHLHADRVSYPETAGDFGRYEPDSDIVRVDGSKENAFITLAHEATHQLLYDTAFRERNGFGEITPWVNEGLAEYVAMAVARVPNLVFDPGRPVERYFRIHAGAADPYDLTRVVAFSAGDYEGTSDRQLKYAQSYTLVHFLLHGAEARYRPGFMEFLREVYAGKGSATDLKRCLDVEWRSLEKEWHAYARNMRF